MEYWTFTHQWTDISYDELKNKIGEALSSKCAMAQYEYGDGKYEGQVGRKVTELFNSIKRIKEGDVIFLKAKNKVYAYGNIIKPRKAGTDVLKLQDFIDAKSSELDGVKYNSDKKNYLGVIAFSDVPIFYFDFSNEKDKSWGQRIDVDDWHNYNENGVYLNEDYYLEEDRRRVIRKLKKDKAQSLIINLGGDVAKMNMQRIKEYTQILKMKKNIILQGAPGTGKTYNTASIAVAMIDGIDKLPAEHSNIMKRYEELVKSKEKAESKETQIQFCTFHQSMDYEDFVEGLKPQVDEKGNISYAVEDGIFKQICNRARNDKNGNYVLIIDEINRGNVSKIFGELITLLEADKRTKANISEKDFPVTVTLPYSKDSFTVPDNLYIIGTMNTTDRSTGTIDYAVRRRFAFITLEANEEVIENETAKALFNDVKAYIEKNLADKDMDIKDLMVGHSYFMAEDDDELRLKIEYEVIPLLREYIKDGILKADKETESYFDSWIDLQPYYEESDDDESEEDESEEDDEE